MNQTAEETVHTAQQIFRIVLDALSRPGKVQKLTTDAHYAGELYPETMEIARTLLDGEVSFYVANQEKATEDELKIWTLATSKSSQEADFIFLPKNTTIEQKVEVMKQAKKGTLLYPNESATVVIECEELTDETVYKLEGPGIKDSHGCSISGAQEWINAREEKNQEYPLGVDLFCIDKSGHLIGLPRTTRVTSSEIPRKGCV